MHTCAVLHAPDFEHLLWPPGAAACCRPWLQLPLDPAMSRSIGEPAPAAAALSAKSPVATQAVPAAAALRVPGRACQEVRCLQVGGIEQLLELAETGAGLHTEGAVASGAVAIYHGDDEQPEVWQLDMHGTSLQRLHATP